MLVTKFIIRVTKFVIHVTKFVTKTFCADSENCLRKEEKLSCRKENFSRSSCDLSRYVARSYRIP